MVRHRAYQRRSVTSNGGQLPEDRCGRAKSDNSFHLDNFVKSGGPIASFQPPYNEKARPKFHEFCKISTGPNEYYAESS